MANHGNEFWKYCAHCGAELDLTDWPPVVETTIDDGQMLVHSFCDSDCKAAWMP
ncbi:DUF7576 family protein [Natrarchaeobius chitinivorans]